MTCLCTGLCRIPPYTCGGTIADRIPWEDIIPMNPWTPVRPAPWNPAPDISDRIELDRLQTELAQAQSENDRLRRENESLRRRLREAKINF